MLVLNNGRDSCLLFSHDWRATERLIRHFCSIQHCFPEDKIYTKVYPLVYDIVTSHCAQPIKSAACESLARLIRCNRKFDQRTEMVAKIVSELAGSGDSSAKRKIYIGTTHVIVIITPSFFSVGLQFVPNSKKRQFVTNSKKR